MKQIIYCISGLGADERAFENLLLEGVELRFISWVQPKKNESLASYASRMAASITEQDAVLLGVSFGGMMAIEIAKQVPVKKLIIVSSIKSAKEMPRWMRFSGSIRLNKVLPLRVMKTSVPGLEFIEKLENYRLGAFTEEEIQMVRSYRRSTDLVYLKWAINQIINWKHNEQVPNLVHIHGANDRIFPAKKIKADYMVEDATHMMIHNRAKEVSECILKALKK